MNRVREFLRIVAVLFAAGFIVGCVLEVTLYKTISIDVSIAAMWGGAFIIVGFLGDRAKWILKEKAHMRKEEICRLKKDIDKEITKLRSNLPRLISSDGEGDHTLAGIYVDRIIELEKLKVELDNGFIVDGRTDSAAGKPRDKPEEESQ